jgi:hypothetical protein
MVMVYDDSVSVMMVSENRHVLSRVQGCQTMHSHMFCAHNVGVPVDGKRSLDDFRDIQALPVLVLCDAYGHVAVVAFLVGVVNRDHGAPEQVLVRFLQSLGCRRGRCTDRHDRYRSQDRHPLEQANHTPLPR